MPIEQVSSALFGQTVKRREDRRFLTGQGTYTGDRWTESVLHAFFVRSPHAHALIRGIDADGARGMNGVIGVFTAADLAAGQIGAMPTGVAVARPDGKPAPRTPRPALAQERVRYVGEPVALVVAKTLAAAMDASERVQVDYEDLPALINIAEALAPGAPVLWDEAPDNIAYLWRGGDMEATHAALRRASHVTTLDLQISRVTAAPIEPRGCFAVPTEAGGLELHIAHQAPHLLHGQLVKGIVEIDSAQLRVAAGDVGGSFGMKAGVYPEDIAVLWAARHLGRPVNWTSTRIEALLSDEHARDVKTSATLGLEGDRITALRIRHEMAAGAYLSDRSTVSLNNIGGISGVYRIAHVAAELYGVMTNTAPTGPYRGAGRPEATFIIERLIDVAAREVGIDPFKLRARNLIPPKAMPYKTSFVFTYDTGDFPGNMEEAAKLADLKDFPKRRRETKKRGMLRGIGICNPIEVAGGPFLKPGKDNARVSVRPDGMIVLDTGAMSVGQGLETAFSQLVADTFGVPLERVEYRQGDTATLPTGRGSGGSAALSVGGTALALAAKAVLDRATDFAADALEVSRGDVEFTEGRFVVAGTDRAIELAAVAKMADDAQRPLRESAEFQPEKVNFPNGCHICEVEVDPQTGRVQVISYCAVEDVGRVLNAALVEGQVHGGVAQGIGQALGEQIVYESGTGQLLTASFMDYAMPRAIVMPTITLVSREMPTESNALGVKGVGEAGAVGALAATINAICDALAPLGVRHFDMPATPARVWAAIQAAKKAGKA